VNLHLLHATLWQSKNQGNQMILDINCKFFGPISRVYFVIVKSYDNIYCSKIILFCRKKVRKMTFPNVLFRFKQANNCLLYQILSQVENMKKVIFNDISFSTKH